MAITTDQYNMIVDYHIMENQQDNAIVLPVADRMIAKYKVYSWSFDKGFWDLAQQKIKFQEAKKAA